MAETWFDKLKRAVSDQFERTFSSAHMSAGVCSSYSLTQVRDLLKHGASISKRAKTAGAFVKYSGVLGSGGDKLAEAAGKIDGLVKKGRILSTIAEFNFFGQMQDLMHPENSNAHGRAMRQAMGVDN